MSYSVLYTLLPAGIDAARGVAKLALVASPREVIASKALGDSVLHQWPAIIGAIKNIHVRDALSQVKTPPIPAVITSEAPSLELWQSIFPASAPVTPFKGTDAPVLTKLETAYSVVNNAKEVDALYAEVLRSGASERLQRAHPVAAKVAALAGGDDGDDARAAAAGLASVAATARRLRRRAQALAKKQAAARAGAPAAVPPPLTASIRSVDDPDAHQVIGMLMDHPALARQLGLIVDLEIPIFRGEQILRAVDAEGVPLNGPIAVAQPWSHVVCDPDRGLFVMKPQADAPAGSSEIVDGMLDLRADNPGGKYALTDMDVLSSSLQLSALAERLATSAKGDPGALPGRRNGGLTLAQADRATRTLEHAITRSGRFDKTTDEIAGAPVLYADDMTAGYRVDVSRDGGPFQSLMQRVVAYHIGDTKQPFMTVIDEGQVEAGSAVEGVAEDGSPLLLAGEELFAWNDWSLVAPRPGLVAGGDGGPNTTAEFVGPGRLKNFPLRIDVQVKPGSLPRLRYGSVYQVRVRAVDPAGRSIEPAQCNPALVSPPMPYRRLQRAGAPQLVARKAYGRGETQERLIVRGDGDGKIIDAICERHVLPPSTAHDVAQMHGAFDAALGPDSPERSAAREALLRIGLRQDAALHDPVVIGPGGSVVPARGITVARLDPASKAPLATLPLPRGTSLPPGQYVHHDTDQMLVPYLVDPAVHGAAFRGLPAIGTAPTKAPVVMPFFGPGVAWPDAKPFRLIARAGTSAATEIVKAGDGHFALAVTLPPAGQVTATLSSALTPAAVKQMDPTGIADATQAAQGELHPFSQTTPVTLLHAVMKPLVAPTLTLATIERPNTGNTWVRLAGSVGAHTPSTSRVDIEASWTEFIDDGEGHVAFEPRRIVMGSKTFGEDASTQGFDLKQSFGDAKRRIVSVTPAATTRFTDCFAPAGPGKERTLQRLGAPQVVDVLSTQRPPPPQVHSCIPIFRWLRQMKSGVYTSIRRFAGVRVYLRPKWFVTGEGESLGVVVHTSNATAQTMQASADADLFTRWGSDPYVASSDVALGPLDASIIANATTTLAFRDLPGATTNNTTDVFTVAAVPVAFDADRGLWFADIELVDLAGSLNIDWAFFRFGLVRVQPGTVAVPPNQTPRHVSGVVVTDFVQFVPKRVLTARRIAPTAVTVELSPVGSKAVCTGRWQKRLLDPLAVPAPAPDVTVDGTNLPILTPATPGSTTRRGTVNESPITVSPELFNAGRIVVEEEDSAFNISKTEGSIQRTVYRDVVECSVFDRADGPVEG